MREETKTLEKDEMFLILMRRQIAVGRDGLSQIRRFEGARICA
jgi:hypothetical protein